MDYGKAFRQIRDERGLSRTEVAAKLGCTTSALSKIENGKVVPKTATIANFCRHCAVPTARFYTIAFGPDDFCISE